LWCMSCDPPPSDERNAGLVHDDEIQDMPFRNFPSPCSLAAFIEDPAGAAKP
jgi:hypothetical protein